MKKIIRLIFSSPFLLAFGAIQIFLIATVFLYIPLFFCGAMIDWSHDRGFDFWEPFKDFITFPLQEIKALWDGDF
jgi:hypothetical protein